MRTWGRTSSEHHNEYKGVYGNIQDVGIHWPQSHALKDQNSRHRFSRHELNNTDESREMMVRNVTEDAISELLDITTGKQESVTSSITTCSTVNNRAENSTHLHRPKRRKISLTRRIYGKKDNLPNRLEASASGLKRKRSQESRDSWNDGDYNGSAFLDHHNLFSMKSPTVKDHISSNVRRSWSGILFDSKGLCNQIDSGSKRKRLTQSSSGSDPSADILQRLCVAPSMDEKNDRNGESLDLVLFDSSLPSSSQKMDKYSMTLYEMFRDVNRNRAV
jgi:hypothetical protein